MADVKWIKLCTDVFDDEKIILIDALPERDGVLVIWFKLLCMAGKQNNGGVFMLNDKIAYTDEMLATIFRRPVNVVRLALQTFEQFGMIEIINNTITIPNWEKHQNLKQLQQAKEKTRKRVAKHREKQKLIASGEDCNALRNVTVTESNADREEEEKKRKRKDLDLEKEEEVAAGATATANDDANNILEKFCGNVLLTENQIGALLDIMPLEVFDDYVARLNNYILDNDVTIKSHYQTIKKWYDEDRAV